jgi:hypothetical protein
MFTISQKGKMSAVHMRYPNAREALSAYRRLEEEGATELSVTDNRIHELIERGELEQHAEIEEAEADRL